LQEPGGILEALARKGARQLLAQAMEAEVAEFVEKHSGMTDKGGQRLAVRNGHLPERELVTGIGPLRIRQPRVDDRGLAQEQRFSSQILPRYLRRVASVDNLIPILCLKGISGGAMSEAFGPFRGPRGCMQTGGGTEETRHHLGRDGKPDKGNAAALLLYY